jgi:hypothetical protein
MGSRRNPQLKKSSLWPYPSGGASIPKIPHQDDLLGARSSEIGTRGRTYAKPIDAELDIRGLGPVLFCAEVRCEAVKDLFWDVFGHERSSAVWLHHHLDAAVLLPFEGLIHVRAVLERAPMGDDEGRINLAFLYHVHQLVHVVQDIALTHFYGDALLEGAAKRDHVEKTAIDARKRDGTTGTHVAQAVAQCMDPICSKTRHSHCFVCNRIPRTMAVRFHSHGVDATVGTSAFGDLVQPLVNIFFFEVNRLRAGFLRKCKPFGNSVNGNDTLSPEHE